MDVLEGLNPEQRQAAEHDTGPMLVVAGAGTGKTQVITRRIAHLILSNRAGPSRILALTFTERAAREMEERLYSLIGWQSFQVPVMTFHAFGGELIGRYANHIGRSVRGGLLNDTQKTLLLMQYMPEAQLEYYTPASALYEFTEGIVEYIGRLQNAGVTVGEYAKFLLNISQHYPDMHPRDVAEQRDLQRLYALYEDIKRRTGTYDFHDQLLVPLEIIQSHTNIAERLRHEYQYVLVDEYQDTNAVQDQLLRGIVGRGGNIFAVGDDDQAIYGFRGADIGNILGFADHFALQSPVALIQNYRSGQPILDASYRLIRHNDPQRLEVKLNINKRLIGLHDEAEVRFQPYRTATDEQQGVAESIANLIDTGTEPSSIAVLSATHAPLKSLAKVLRVRNIGFSLSTAVTIFEQPELLTLWYLLNWIAGRADDEAISHVLLGPFLRWDHASYQRLKTLSQEKLVGLEAGLALDEAKGQQLMKQLHEWRAQATREPVSRLLFRLVFESGMVEHWRQQALQSGRMVRVFEDLQRLLEHMQDFETVSNDGTAQRYLATFPKPPELAVTEAVGDPSGVSLLTVHASKGLEFDTVFVIGCTQRNWSRGGSAGRIIPEVLTKTVELSPEHEYRRLFYVALTRARSSLVVSSAIQTASGARQMISPFVEETFGPLPKPNFEEAEKDNKIELLMSKIQRYYPLQSLDGLGSMPYERPDGWIELSVTALSQYDYCPFEFYLEHGLKLAQPVGPQLSFGTVLHRIFELYYRARMTGQEHPKTYWHELLNQQWSDQGYERREFAEADLALARETIERFIDREAAEKRLPLGVEVPVRLEIPDIKLRLRGKIDAIFQQADGLELRDYKTGRTKTDAEKLAKAARDNFQLRTYALAYELLGDARVASVVLDYVVTGIIGEAYLSPVIMRNHRTKLGAMVERIRARDFAPATGGIHQCSAVTYYGSGEKDELALELLAKKDPGYEA